MDTHKTYRLIQNFDLHKFESIVDKNVIHEFENKNLSLDLENLEDKYIVNQLR